MGRFDEDDLVRTILDDEHDVPDFDESVDIESNSLRRETNAKRVAKRKREDVITNKKKSRQKLSDPAETTDTTPAEALEPTADDATFDPDFVFQLGSTGGQVDIPLGWDANGGAEKAFGSNIDEIVARRKANRQQETSTSKQLEKDSQTVRRSGGFGAEDVLLPSGVPPEQDSSDVGDVEDFADASSAKDGEDGHIEDDGSHADDSGSEADPVPHPDDLSDQGDGEDEDKETVEAKQRRKAFFADEEVGKPVSTTDASFQHMSLSRPILRGLGALGFSSPTPIQAKTIPVALLGKDVVGGAVTGSGKTAAFIIPILERLLYRPKKVPTTRVGILMPTRELAVQCFKVASTLASFTDITFVLLVGGLSLREQEQTLKKRPDVVIATPGRFIDHMRNSASFAVETLEILVLDEADRMLEDGFADELNEILKTIPKSRQTMLFSATMTENVDKLIRAGLNRPVRLMVDEKKKTVAGLVQEFIKIKGGKGEVDEERRLGYLVHLCQNTYTSKTIVFLPRKASAHRVKILFSIFGIKAAELHGSMSQEQRLSALSAFQSGSCTHLLATDLASRGLDIARVETVLNFTVPTTTTTYLHRVGRTARAGQSGVSCTLFAGVTGATKTGGKKKDKAAGPSERTHLRPILKLARAQNASIRTRTLPVAAIEDLTAQIQSLDGEIESILEEEKEERLLQQTERDVTKGENLVKYEDEIASRPRRTWFQSEKEKEASSKLGMEERKGVEPKKVKEKKKLSGKDKKRLLDRDERIGGKSMGWKKGKDERAGKGVLQQPKDQGKHKQSKSSNVRKTLGKKKMGGAAKGRR